MSRRLSLLSAAERFTMLLSLTQGPRGARRTSTEDMDQPRGKYSLTHAHAHTHAHTHIMLAKQMPLFYIDELD